MSKNEETYDDKQPKDYEKEILKIQMIDFLNDSLFDQMTTVIKRFKEKFGTYESGSIKFYNARNDVEIHIDGIVCRTIHEPIIHAPKEGYKEKTNV